MYAYRAARADGTTLDGHIEGDDEQFVRAKLEADGLFVFRVSARGGRTVSPPLALAAWHKLPMQEFMIFNQELLALVKAGLPVLRVWDLLIERTQRTAFREALQGVRQDIGAARPRRKRWRGIHNISPIYTWRPFAPVSRLEISLKFFNAISHT